MDYEIENLFVRTILKLENNSEVSLDKETEDINNKKSKRTSEQRKELVELFNNIRKGD